MEAASVDSGRNPISSVLRALVSRGWCFRDTQRIEGMIGDQLSSDAGTCTVDSMESELVDMDLRSIGGKCLPDSSAMCKASHLRGPVVLQVCSIRDITQTSIREALGNSGNRRLLLMMLTDGHSEVKAVEYSHLPLLHEDVIPGTKVRFQNKVDICSGIVCLNSKVVTILGGLVQSLHEEWQMKRKYLVESLKTSKFSRENALTCPPPFEKLQIHALTRGISSFSGASSNDKGQISFRNDGVHTTNQEFNVSNIEGASDDANLPHNIDKETKNSSITRLKATAAAPVQNQLAAQKLLQKTTQPDHSNRNLRNQRYRGKGKHEESVFLTLDEWEKRKTGIDLPTTSEHYASATSQDEDLAMQLQQQFDLEDVHEQRNSHATTDAENLRMSMFNFERDDTRGAGRAGMRSRGRGRRSRGRGRF